MRLIHALILLILSFSSTLNMSLVAAEKKGTESGGGGDPLEERVSQIRSDLLRWIGTEGPKDLLLPYGLTHASYVSKMSSILTPQRVVVAFVEKDDELNGEMKVSVEGVPKTCRGFIAKATSQPHIICNISRFLNTKESDQYRLIHHEFAGLVGIERNRGAASDYRISSQITDFLSKQSVYKLAIKKQLSDKCKMIIADAHGPYSKAVNFLNSKVNPMTGAKEQVAIFKNLEVTIVELEGERGINIVDTSHTLLFASDFKKSTLYMAHDYSVQISCE